MGTNSEADHYTACADLLFNEARYLDEKRWEEFLALYLEDAEYWVPAWDNENETTQDPQSEISLMYYADRSGLEDRVFRVKSGLSSASTPLARTCHMISNVQVARRDGGDSFVRSTWQTTSYRFKETHYFCGWYEHTLRPTDEGLRIARKKVIVINDLIPNVMDFYHL
jgi:3-phenylpropionate/cinnamic acid dioxygenase small subunit